MNIASVYFSYLAISIALTVWVARTLHKNGRIFLVDAFHGNTQLADAVNHLLVVGFYLINVGYITLALKANPAATIDSGWNVDIELALGEYLALAIALAARVGDDLASAAATGAGDLNLEETLTSDDSASSATAVALGWSAALLHAPLCRHQSARHDPQGLEWESEPRSGLGANRRRPRRHGRQQRFLPGRQFGNHQQRPGGPDADRPPRTRRLPPQHPQRPQRLGARQGEILALHRRQRELMEVTGLKHPEKSTQRLLFLDNEQGCHRPAYHSRWLFADVEN